ncbi:MAG: hypothetical protein OEZ13_11400 [Spirochaetia bacterium]|nr:hypothetical protein [Spirochaetia bacterium]
MIILKDMLSSQVRIRFLTILITFLALGDKITAQEIETENRAANKIEDIKSTDKEQNNDFNLPKDYKITLGYFTDLRFIASNGILFNKLGYDLYYKLISPHMPQTIGKFVEPVWNAFVTFHFTLWPHEAGHWCRANQADGNFIMTKYQFPIPVMKMIMPEGGPLPEQEAVMSSGGFEINNLMRRQTEYDFYLKGYRYTEDMAHSFIQSIFFPMYTLLFAFTDPKKPQTWENTYGDPVQYTKIIFEHYYGRPSINAENKTDPALVALYNEIFWVNLAATFLDPMLYQSAPAMTADINKRPLIRKPWLLGDNAFRWMFSLQFNPGALGYEVYFTNHFRISEKYFALNIRYGRPFKNYGFGIFMPEVFSGDTFSLGASVDVFNQAIFGAGFGVSLIPAFHFGQNYKIALDISYKSKGYILGRKLEKGAEFLLHTILEF